MLLANQLTTCNLLKVYIKFYWKKKGICLIPFLKNGILTFDAMQPSIRFALLNDMFSEFSDNFIPLTRNGVSSCSFNLPFYKSLIEIRPIYVTDSRKFFWAEFSFL